MFFAKEDPLAGSGVEPGVNKGNFEIIDTLAVFEIKLSLVGFGHQSEVGGKSFLIEEKIFDVVGFVSERQDKFIETAISIDFHNMPDNRLISHIDHGFGFKFRFFFEPGASATTENDCFHVRSSL